MKKQNFNTQFVLILIFAIFSFLIVAPFIILISVSLSSEKDILLYGYSLLPKSIDFSAYQYVFKNPQSILNAYKVTITFAALATSLGVLFMSLLAYPLSRKDLKGRNIISFFVYFTLLFNGGLVPTYILITQVLKLGDTIWVYILPTLISPWYVFMIRTFFSGIPNEICEAALIDGAHEYTIFFKMILPLSKPVLAAVALFVFLAKWNDWFTAMIYINNENLLSLQYLLQRIMKNIQLLLQSSSENIAVGDINKIPTETVRMAMAVIVAGPALIVFPFFQKYFVKGLTVGSVKG